MSAITPEKAGKVSKMDPSQPNDSNEVRGADSNGSAEKSERIASSEDASHEYPKAFSLALIMVGLCLAVLLVALDNTILVTAIPKITDAFQSINDIGWYGSAYLLTTCSLQLFYGKLYTLFSIKVVFMGAISIFELGSLICGIATTSTVLIVGRAVAGSGAAGILSGSMIIIAHNVPLQQRPVYTGATMGMYGIASVVGPLLGGILTDHVSWRWCFYINLPIGGAVLLVVGFFLSTPIRRQQESLTWGARLWTLDPLGMVFFIPSIICLLLALQLGGSTYAWSNARIIALFIVFGLLLLAFIVVQIWLGEIATIPIRILKNRSIISALWYGFFLGASFFIFIYYLPTWFQAIQSVRATASGLHLLPITISQLLGVIISGALTTLFGYYTPFMVLGTVFMSVGGGLLMKLDVQSPARAWIGYQVIYGLGAGFGFQQPTLAAQTVLDLQDVPVGVATAMFSQLLGGALFVSVGQNVFSNKLLSSAAKELPGIDLGKLIKTGATELVHLVPESQLEKLLEVYNGALQKAFMVGLILSVMTVVGAITMEWRSMKNKDETTAA